MLRLEEILAGTLNFLREAHTCDGRAAWAHVSQMSSLIAKRRKLSAAVKQKKKLEAAQGCVVINEVRYC